MLPHTPFATLMASLARNAAPATPLTSTTVINPSPRDVSDEMPNKYENFPFFLFICRFNLQCRSSNASVSKFSFV